MSSKRNVTLDRVDDKLLHAEQILDFTINYFHSKSEVLLEIRGEIQKLRAKIKEELMRLENQNDSLES